MRVHICLLRRPRRNDAYERRADPFWEFGSFGLTGCHSANLLHPKHLHRLEGAHIAFVQGGDEGLRLVCVTPAVKVHNHGFVTEAKWESHDPLKYRHAPLVGNNEGESDLALLFGMGRSVRRSTAIGRFASKFRSRQEALPDDVAAEVFAVYSMRHRVRNNRALHFTETLPYPPSDWEYDRAQYNAELLSGHLRPDRRLGCAACGPVAAPCVDR